jgi:hypothetical protein
MKAFVPPEEAHFDPTSVVDPFAWMLAIAFLAGFETEAKKSTKSAGKATFNWFKGLVSDLFDKKDGGATQEANRLARGAPNTALKLSEAQITEIADRVTDQLRKELEGKLAPRRAADLAKKIRDKTTNRVLKRKKR